MNPSIEKLFKLPTSQKAIIWSLVLLGVLLLFYFLLFKSKVDDLKKQQNTLNDLRTQIEENRKIADNLPRLTQEYNQLNLELTRALTELPNQQEIPSLLTSITSAGKGAGLDFLVFRPKPEAPKDFYAEVPVDVSVYGSYLSVARFFIAVSDLPRIVNISNVSFSDINSKGGITTAKVTCLATTFRFLDKKEVKNEKKAK